MSLVFMYNVTILTLLDGLEIYYSVYGQTIRIRSFHQRCAIWTKVLLHLTTGNNMIFGQML